MGDERFLSLLGLPPTANMMEMREAYERAMQAAAQSHDVRRAKALSAAFDELPSAVRRAMYSVRGTPITLEQPAPTQVIRRRARGPQSRPIRGYRLPTVLLVLIALLAVAALGYADWHSRTVQAERGTQQGTRLMVPDASSATPPHASAAGAPILQAIGLPVGLLQETGWREYAPPPRALVDAEGATQGRCMPSTGGPLSPFSRIAAGSLMVCPTGWVGVYRISG